MANLRLNSSNACLTPRPSKLRTEEVQWLDVIGLPQVAEDHSGEGLADALGPGTVSEVVAMFEPLGTATKIHDLRSIAAIFEEWRSAAHAAPTASS